MKMHEALYSIKGLHDSLELEVANKGEWCWPTRELLAENVNANLKVLGKNARADIRRQMGIARRRGWLVEGPCVPHCHARQVRLTTSGAEALRLMNEAVCGCCSTCRVPEMREAEVRVKRDRECQTSSVKFKRRAA
jgi:hypothetical protein